MNSVNFKPVGDKILVKRTEAETKKNGIILPNPEKINSGTVVSFGEGRIVDSKTRIFVHVNVGDLVYFNPYSGVEIQLDNEKYLIISETDLLGKIPLT